jgi:hypothetical protein
MNISDLYPSKYIKADDLQGQQAPVTIMSITVEEIADKEFKPVMRFMGKDKGMVLNKTNAINCASVWGDDTIAWQGQQATLLAAPVMFQGKQVMGLQLLPKLAQQQQQQQAGGFNHPGSGTAQQNAQVQRPAQTVQQNDDKYREQFQQPGPHDVQRPAPAAGAQIAANAAMDAALDNLDQDIDQAQANVKARSQQHQVDPAGDLDDLPF